ncbi:MAG: YcaO-like family protein [Burkholderiales bacterium]|nr:YcaO-like family protein [Burkholderiales bacterium]MDE1928514.1 YcaO-like family protein [Burkholderiales bacterium]MDE2159313.1 YcaO-like family protein [Burkholderiales bacterium]MDE2504978.1 YcaO-like family protein [Burkholderiales bacterium]
MPPRPGLRSRPARATVALARRLMPVLGISRVTDITRLDRLGLPVAASVRPRGLTLRVHAGKGLHLDDARAGALMEAVEYAVAERASAGGAEYGATLAQWAAQLPHGLKAEDFAPRLDAVLAPRRRIGLVRCEELGCRRSLLVPAELALMPDAYAAPAALFGASTNGLASGNTLEEATLHGLLEVLERDARALNAARDRSARLANARLPPPFAAWAAAWRRAGIELIVRQLPNDFELPCFEAHLWEPASPDVNLAAGAGLHPDRGVALARAVSEAAQSRLSLIHGGRDDITGFYAKYRRADQSARHDAEQRLVAGLADVAASVDFAAVPGFECRPVRATLAWLRARLAERGFPCVLRHRMRPRGIDLLGFEVVKIVVPRCESLLGAAVCMGPRLRARVLGRG